MLFDGKIYENVVKYFTQREIVSLERMLLEMDTCSIKGAFASKKGKNGNLVAFCMVNTGKYAEIVYEDCQIIEIKVKGRQL